MGTIRLLRPALRFVFNVAAQAPSLGVAGFRVVGTKDSSVGLVCFISHLNRASLLHTHVVETIAHTGNELSCLNSRGMRVLKTSPCCFRNLQLI